MGMYTFHKCKIVIQSEYLFVIGLTIFVSYLKTRRIVYI